MTRRAALIRTICDRRRIVIGPDHPDTLSTAVGLANDMRAEGRVPVSPVELLRADMG